MAERPKRDPDNVVPFRKPVKPREPLRLPSWVPKELVSTVTGWIVLANLLVWIAMIVVSRGAGVFTRFDPETTFAFGSLVPDLIAVQPWRLLSSTFVHADLGHIAMNMAILWFTGRQLERAYGSGRFAALYLVACLTGSVFSLVWHLTASPGTSVGASGGVLGVVAALAAFYWRATGRHSPHTKQWLWFCGLGVVGGLIMSSFGMAVDNAAHIGGMTGGFLLSYYVFAGAPSWTAGVSRTMTAVLLLAGAGSVGASLFSGGDIEVPVDASMESFQRGQRALLASDWATAEVELQKAIESASFDRPMIRTLRASALQELGRDDEALAEIRAADTEFRELREREPNNATIGLAHATMLRAAGRDDEAVDALKEAVRGRAPDGMTFSRISELLEELGQLDEARLAAAKARIAEPRNQLFKLQHARINEKIAARGGATPAPEASEPPAP